MASAMKSLAVPLLLLLPDLAAQGPPARFLEILEQGRQKALAHEWPAALELLDQALELAPEDVEALRWRGHAYTGAERHAEALVDLDKALEAGAGDAWTRYARAMALHHLGRLDEAVRGYTEALAVDPNFHKAHEWRGFTRSMLGDQVGAIVDLDAAIAAEPSNPQAFFVRAKAYAALLDFERAEHDFWKAVDADAENADAWGQLGYLKVCRGEDAAALTMLERAASLDPVGQIEARAWLFHLHLRNGDDAGAAAQLEALRTGAEEGWVSRIAAFLAGEVTAAELVAAALSEDREAAGRECQAWTHIGLEHARQGRKGEALIALARAIATGAREEWEWSWALRTLRDLTE